MIKCVSKPFCTLVVMLCVVQSGFSSADNINNSDKSSMDVDYQGIALESFYKNVMTAEPVLPADLSDNFVSCPVGQGVQNAQFKTSKQVDYQKQNWEQRIASDWDYFTAPKSTGRVLAIDFAQKKQGLGYRYLANEHSYDELYEPWSSSKIMAFTAAVAKARTQGIGALSLAGDIPLADLITSINSYEAFGKADGNSNAIATYFLNMVGRDEASALFHDKWLKLANADVRFRGAYALKVFSPSSPYWFDMNSAQKIAVAELAKGSDDKGYQAYRCDSCGLTGNKPMTTLAQAEWLKRLASHERVASTRQPNLTSQDVEVLFYGTGHSDLQHKVGGMTQGISRMLIDAIAKALSNQDVTNSKKVLDDATDGKWRIWQKIGWGPSETRGAGENVVLAHVCLPTYQGGREFTIAAQTAYPGEGEMTVRYAGLKMQSLLDSSMQQLLTAKLKAN
ncbi:hypothetical protein L0668_01655 [Paraglaciecola aquimarina]|uniref:Uncharacterized protein n=1 Tax=Paraglaciecola algarum TaxID=3050085 RepID=A0ABS9D526_9ALTE|nr:hypothetical protein [Paraglaciecola sp. G1-23]MCF2946796.1 hypothetical protein [Paraglaciecola sp. G1-23]